MESLKLMLPSFKFGCDIRLLEECLSEFDVVQFFPVSLLSNALRTYTK